MRQLTAMPLLGRLVIAVLAAVLGTASMAQDRPRIVAVNYPLQYFAERLLGDAAEVVFPIPDGVDPSFWRPSIADISAIQSADLILLNGAGFATWVDRVSLPRSRLVDTSAAIADRFIATESITHSHGDGGEHSHEGIASYTWLDPALAIAHAEAVAAAITSRDLAPAADVEERLAALRADLEVLDNDARTALTGAQEVVFVATHPRYQYLARAYDLTILSLEWEAGAMPSDDALGELEKMIQDEGARILIWEADPPAAAKEAATRLGVSSVTFPPLATTPESGSYLDVFKASLSALSGAVS